MRLRGAFYADVGAIRGRCEVDGADYKSQSEVGVEVLRVLGGSMKLLFCTFATPSHRDALESLLRSFFGYHEIFELGSIEFDLPADQVCEHYFLVWIL